MRVEFGSLAALDPLVELSEVSVPPPRSRAYRPTPFVGATLAAHGVGALALLYAPSTWPLVGAGLLANHLAIGASALWPRSRLMGPNLSQLVLRPGERRVALTFDDGPDPAVTPALLTILERRAVKASFFCLGRNVDAHPELTAEIAGRGHCVENHTYGHPHAFAFYGPRAMAREIDLAQQSIERATGRRPRHFRAPVGFRNPWLELCLARAGLTLVSWSRRGFDAVSGDVSRVASRLTDGLQAGDIVLLHDGNSARDGQGRPVVLEVLPRLLDALAERGLEPGPVVSG